ncbi:hypothetical protein [Streptomyces sp. NPDC096132]|uniref:hypothetical protein n=1 Tax=Streptomyces sp. NPDC096132 TaxID=3366075 RepID=UPI0037FB338F
MAGSAEAALTALPARVRVRTTCVAAHSTVVSAKAIMNKNVAAAVSVAAPRLAGVPGGRSGDRRKVLTAAQEISDQMAVVAG